MTFVSARHLPYVGARCERCSLHSRCLTMGLEGAVLADFDAMLERPRPLKRGETLVHQGDRFANLYAVRSGSLKQVVAQGEVRDQVTHFYLPGELVGLDGIGGGDCPGNLVALESTYVCEFPFSRLEVLMQDSSALQNRLFHTMGEELRDHQRMMCLLSGRTADQRMASFLSGLSERFRLRGYSPTCFYLSMSRGDIGSYLGLAIETVSRVLGRFQQQQLITLEGRQVSLVALEKLRRIAEEGAGRHSGG
ncbi:helix-turn-helix domain-containing protein [Billgrantia montanilacus]|uniref:Crp/Fnr family transcriptional regulator n=1 Tax=Billgrantia montanilacus TaxID=2282305 RepID=A0A368TXH9_9GAMM|nr:helix-turn-helix domain-containing protein [Halomonas montanilacus]RCV89519.1 Crp/Fnr family transcriptional regulator [Halomonas montanilacus]